MATEASVMSNEPQTLLCCKLPMGTFGTTNQDK